MTANWIGMLAALAAFLGIWLGHVSVRKIEYHSETVWLPSGVAFVLGVLLEAGALQTDSLAISAVLGILGITVLWDSLEFWRQQKRVGSGHAPANPDNPRHARLLQSSRHATTINWLDRQPLGRQLTTDEIRRIKEGAQ
jgi:hypothetical protein